MSEKPKVVEFKREGWRDTVKTLRSIADRIESGELARCDVGVFVMMGEDNAIDTFGMGSKGEDLALLGLLRCAEQVIIESTLYPE
tara:strand:+ start:581 stop:835 length:255 start_codon:yes stop_codon:yes gene_type:complete